MADLTTSVVANSRCFLCALTLCFSFVCNPLIADENMSMVKFKSGGEIKAQVMSEVSDGARKYVVLKTEAGAILKLEKSKIIVRITEPGNDWAIYQSMLEAVDDTTSSHWQIYEWCREKSRRGQFKSEAIYHLRRIVDLDPSDEKAWRSFKSVDPNRAFIKVGAKWIPEQQHFLSTGYVKVDGKWVSRLQKEANDRIDARERLENDRKQRLKKWKRYVLPKEEPSEVRAKLFRLVDPVSIPFVESNYLKREDDPRVRALYLDAIGQVESPDAQRILVQYAMTDPHEDVREQAMVMLEQENHFDAAVSARLISKFLRAANNNLVNRAGRMLGRLKSPQVILNLVNALETVHVVRTGDDPGRLSTTFSSNGGTGLSTGGNPTQKIKLENDDVLAALETISGQSFRFDEQAWRDWYLDQHTTTSNNVRRTIEK